ncbi:ComEC/Rec2 family competence protein [Umezawaea tangerina]|nr:hydrolase [Umezawaea tangerina]
MMIDINNSTSLPEEDIAALAENKGLSTFAFKHGVGFQSRSWEEYYKSLLVDPFEYYKENFNGKSVFRYIQTHPDMDHLSGLHRFFWQEKVPLINFWDVDHEKEISEEDFNSLKYSYVDWLVYSLLRKGNGPDDTDQKVLNKYNGDMGDYWTSDGISVLSPTDSLIEKCNRTGSYNDCSYVLSLSYGGRRVILPGDAEAAAWTSILDSNDKSVLRCDILKAAHHGRKSGYHEEAVTTMDPSIVVCSVGKKPSTDASQDYARVADSVLSTRYQGSIIATIWDDGEVWVDNHKGERISSLPIL